jgi:hypothetical protein
MTNHESRVVSIPAIALIIVIAFAVWTELAFGWIEPAFDSVAHLFYEIPLLARVRRPTQLPLVRGHLGVLALILSAGLLAWPKLSAQAKKCWGIFVVAYTLRAIVWIAGGNLPLVPGDSCHYLEVARSVYQGEGPVKHYVESFFSDYPAIREGRGVLDDWATPLQAYVLAGAFRLVGVEPCRDLEETVGVAKGVSFLLNMLTLPCLYLFARRRFDCPVALGATAVLAVLPVHAIYAGFALRESLVGLTSVAAIWTLTEVWSASSTSAAWGWAVVAGACGGLAILARNTALALLAGGGLYALVAHRRRVGPVLLWGSIVGITIAPWAWATYREYGQPFHSYTNYFQYNFSWTVHHYEKGNTKPAEFYNARNAPEIVRVKVKSAAIIVVTATMIFSLPLMIAAFRRLERGADVDRLVAVLASVFVVATLVNVADVTQVAQLGRYYLPLFVIALPTATAGLFHWAREVELTPRARPLLALSLVALLWADPTWAYDAGWLVKPYQLHWPALREAADWVKSHPDVVPQDARIMTWFPWELRVVSGRTTVLMPRNYSRKRIDEVIRQYGVTHVLWGSFEPPPHIDPEMWGPLLENTRVALGLTEPRELHASPRGMLYPVRLFRLR